MSQQEHILTERIRLTEKLYESLLHIEAAGFTSKNEILDYILNEAIAITQSKIGYIYLYDEDSAILTNYAWSKDVMNACKVMDPQVEYLLEKTGLWGEAIRQRKPIITNDYQADHPYKKGLPEGHVPLVRHVNVPVFQNDQIIALIGVANKETDYDDFDVRNLHLLMTNAFAKISHFEAEQLLAESEEKYRATFNQAAAGIVHTTPEGRVLEANRTFCGIVGYEYDEVIHMTVEDLTHPEDLPKDMALMRNLMRGKFENYTLEKRYIRKDSSISWVNLTVSAMRDSAGTVTRLIKVVQDINVNKAAERELEKYRTSLEDLVIERTGEYLKANDQLKQENEARKAIETELYHSKNMLQLVLDNIPQRVFWKDSQLNYLGCNRAFANDVNLTSPDEITGRNDLTVSWMQKADLYRADDRKVMKSGIPKLNHEEMQTRKDGSISWVRMNKIPLRDDKNRVIGLLGTYEDISRSKEAEEEVTLFFNTALDMLCIAGFDGFFKRLGPMWSKTLGWTEAELFAEPFIDFVHEEDRIATLAAAASLSEGKNVVSFQNRYRCKDGSYKWIEWNSYGFMPRKIIIAAARDITEKKNTEAALRRSIEVAQVAQKEAELASITDALIGIYNRRYIMEVLKHQQKRVERNKTAFAVAICDLDHFKNVNDTYGHDCGDFVLASFARLVGEMIRGQDIFGRWGGEEFILVLPDTDWDGAQIVCEKIREKVASTSVTYHDSLIRITATFGVARSRVGLPVEQVIKDADKALYQGKESGRNRVVVTRRE